MNTRELFKNIEEKNILGKYFEMVIRLQLLVLYFIDEMCRDIDKNRNIV